MPFGIGVTELVILLVALLIIFGPNGPLARQGDA